MPYVQGFVIAVPRAKKDAYAAMARQSAPFFQEYGALRIVECWGDKVPEGHTTDFRRAVKAEEDEEVVFSWIVWESREACDAAAEKMQQDERMSPPPEMPFDGKRMIYAGFLPLMDTAGELGPQ